MRMKLSQKGRRAPPPALEGGLQGLSETVQSWPGIDACTHWHFSRNGEVDGADYYRDGEELGHLHLEGELHLVTFQTLASALVQAGLARPMRWGGIEDWIVYRICGDVELRRAEWLLRLGYDYLGGTPESELLQRVAAVAPAAVAAH